MTISRAQILKALKYLGQKLETENDGVVEVMALSAQNDNGQSGAEEQNMVKKKATASEQKSKVNLAYFMVYFIPLKRCHFCCLIPKLVLLCCSH